MTDDVKDVDRSTALPRRGSAQDVMNHETIVAVATIAARCFATFAIWGALAAIVICSDSKDGVLFAMMAMITTMMVWIGETIALSGKKIEKPE
jgi:hypothetical protein